MENLIKLNTYLADCYNGAFEASRFYFIHGNEDEAEKFKYIQASVAHTSRLIELVVYIYDRLHENA